MKALSIALALVVGLQSAVFARAGQKTFESLDDAVNALIAAFRAEDRKAIVEILGPKGVPIVWSGDNVGRPCGDSSGSWRPTIARTGSRAEAGRSSSTSAPTTIRSPFPSCPTARGGSGIPTPGTTRSSFVGSGGTSSPRFRCAWPIVDAQREYYSRDRGAGILEYAQRLESTKGKRDGLYWPTRPGERPSPLGPLIAEARAAGYTRPEPGKRFPYHGYLYRMLLTQGPAAPGGAYDFVIKGHMIGGFALVTFPATYAVSGIMTFMVSHDGIVYQKDLGPKTAQIADAMKTFNPDKTWTKVASETSAK